MEIGARTQINYVDQNRLALDDNKTVWEEVGDGSEHVRLGEESITLRSYLRRFLFTEDRINTKIAQLSGGERSRVLLAKILKRGGNVLILDEPTNDLDLATLRLLEEALLGFGGAVIVVSHDRYFLNRVCTHTLAFEGDGVVTLNAGNYDYYREKKAARAASASIAPPPANPPSRPPAPHREARANSATRKRANWRPSRPTIHAAEEEVARLEADFRRPRFLRKHGHEWEALEAKLDARQGTRRPTLCPLGGTGENQGWKKLSRASMMRTGKTSRGKRW